MPFMSNGHFLICHYCSFNEDGVKTGSTNSSLSYSIMTSSQTNPTTCFRCTAECRMSRACSLSSKIVENLCKWLGVSARAFGLDIAIRVQLSWQAGR